MATGAVLERGFSFETLTDVAGVEEAEGLKGLDELVERRLLQEEAGGSGGKGLLSFGDAYSFSHEKIRQVAYTEAGQARRRVLHRRALEVLEGTEASAAELARHALGAGLAGQSFRHSVGAGDEAMEVFAVRDAVEHYERARDLLVAEQRPRGRVKPSILDLKHLGTQLGRAYEVADEWDKARQTYEVMLAFARQEGEAKLEVVALNHLATLVFQRETDAVRARALLEEARRVAEEAGLAEALVETECNLADIVTFWAGESEHSRPLAEKALASARALGRADLVARALRALARLKMFAGRLEESRLEESAAYAEEGAALSRELAERPAPPLTELPSAMTAITGLAASWRVGNKAMEIQCLNYLAYARIFQGRSREGVAIAREAQSISRELPERVEAMGSWALGVGLPEIGEYEEALTLARRGTELARKAQDAFLLWLNLDRLGLAYEALLDLEEARSAYEEALEVTGRQLGAQYEAFSSARLCAVAALLKDWEDAHTHALMAHEGGFFLNPLFVIHLPYQVAALLRGGDGQLAREEVRRFSRRARTNERERIAYLRSLATLSRWEDDAEKATGHLREAESLAGKIGLPGELWQIRAEIGELHERRGEAGEARAAFFRAAQTLRTLADKIGDEKLREGFLSAPRVRRVLGGHWDRWWPPKNATTLSDIRPADYREH